MNNKQLTFSIITIASISIGAYKFLSNSDKDNTVTKVNKKKYSLIETAKKANLKKSHIPVEVLFASDVKTQKNDSNTQTKLKSPLLKESYYRNFTKPQNEIADNLELLEKEHEILLHNMRKEGVKIDPITILKPRFAIAITFHLNLTMGELTESDLKSLKLTNKEWYIIKTFSESKDFALLLKRNSLTSENIQLENLKQYYSRS